MKMKNKIIDFEEKDWLIEEQEKILNEVHRTNSILYADLIRMDEVEKSKGLYINLIDKEKHMIAPSDIIEVNAVSLRYKLEENKIVAIPLDKITSVMYIV